MAKVKDNAKKDAQVITPSQYFDYLKGAKTRLLQKLSKNLTPHL